VTPVEGETVVCRLCHKEGHKSYQCKARTNKKQKKKATRKISNTYINKVDKKDATPYLMKKKKNGKVIAIKDNKQANKGKGANESGCVGGLHLSKVLKNMINNVSQV
jgi:hypothetical protein